MWIEALETVSKLQKRQQAAALRKLRIEKIMRHQSLQDLRRSLPMAVIYSFRVQQTTFCF
jgi:hypothetical protein